MEFRAWDSSEFLDDEETVLHYLTEILKDGDAQEIAFALGNVARARGMTQLAKDTGLSRESLYRALSQEGNPELATVLKVVEALGLRLSLQPKTRTDAA